MGKKGVHCASAPAVDLLNVLLCCANGGLYLFQEKESRIRNLMVFTAGAAQLDTISAASGRIVLGDDMKKIQHQLLLLLRAIYLAEDFAEVEDLGHLVPKCCLWPLPNLRQNRWGNGGSPDEIVPHLNSLKRLEGGREHLSETQDGVNIIVWQKLLQHLRQPPELALGVLHCKMIVSQIVVVTLADKKVLEGRSICRTRSDKVQAVSDCAVNQLGRSCLLACSDPAGILALASLLFYRKVSCIKTAQADYLKY